ncbi:MAG: cytochrome c family protein [Pseudomonadota bacterium]
MRVATTVLVTTLAAGVASGPAHAEGDVGKGEMIFKRCSACHEVEADANGIGPHLFGIVGRTVASVGGYKYSEGMKSYAANGEVWDIARLDRYLTNPKETVKGTKMSFRGLNEDSQRTDVIAYLATLK